MVEQCTRSSHNWFLYRRRYWSNFWHSYHYLRSKCRLYHINNYYSYGSPCCHRRYYFSVSGTYSYIDASISRWYMEQQQSSYSLSRLGYWCCYCSFSHTSTWHSHHYLHYSRRLYHYYYIHSTPSSGAHHRVAYFLRGRKQHPKQCYPWWSMDERQPRCSLYRIRYRCNHG